MATAPICTYIGQAQLQVSDLTAFAGLITAGLPGCKGSSAGYRVSARRATSMSCLFVRGTEWVGHSKDSPLLSPVQYPLPGWDSQTWPGQDGTGAHVSHQWLTTATGGLCCLSECYVPLLFYNGLNSTFESDSVCLFAPCLAMCEGSTRTTFRL